MGKRSSPPRASRILRRRRNNVRGTWLRQAAILSALAFVPAIGEAVYLRERVSWKAPATSDEVSVASAKRWGDNVMWLDARPAEDFEAEHVPGAMLLNQEGFDELLPKVLNAWSPEKKIVVYCSKKTCGASREIARRLRDEAQLKNVYVLDGGWESWVEARK